MAHQFPLAITFALLVSSCAPKPKWTPEQAIAMSRVMLDHIDRVNENMAVIGNVCKFYFRLHGRWPESAAELAGTPSADGSPFEPQGYEPMDFQKDAAGQLKVGFRSTLRERVEVQVDLPTPTTLPATTTSRPSPPATSSAPTPPKLWRKVQLLT